MRLQTSCRWILPLSCPLMDSADPSKTQSFVGTVLSTYVASPPAGAGY